jgi:hypothetical protein
MVREGCSAASTLFGEDSGLAMEAPELDWCRLLAGGSSPATAADAAVAFVVGDPCGLTWREKLGSSLT